MGYVTHVWRSDVAQSNDATLAGTLGLTQGATLISVGAVVATPSSGGETPDTPSSTAKIVWVGPSNVAGLGSTITPGGAKVIARGVSAGEALWIAMTELQ